MTTTTVNEDGEEVITEAIDPANPSTPVPSESSGAEHAAELSNDPNLQLREIRELLFGEQVRQVNTDISARHQEVIEQVSSLARQMDTTFTKFSREIHNRLDDLNNHLEDLNRQHIARENDLAADIDDLRQKLNEAKSSSEQVDNDIRNELHSEAERLGRDLDQRQHEALERINQTAEDLYNNKTDRKTLASLLEKMASNLSTGKLE